MTTYRSLYGRCSSPSLFISSLLSCRGCRKFKRKRREFGSKKLPLKTPQFAKSWALSEGPITIIDACSLLGHFGRRSKNASTTRTSCSNSTGGKHGKEIIASAAVSCRRTCDQSG